MTEYLKRVVSATRRYARGPFGRSVALLVGSTAIGQGVVLLTLPIVGRLYSPTDLGRLGTFLAFLGVASVVTAFRYDIMIVAAASDAEAGALLAGVCWVTAPVSLLCSMGLALLIHYRLLGFDVLPLEAALWMFPSLVVTQLYFTLRYWLMRDAKFSAIAKVTIGQNAARGVTPLALYPLAPSWVGLLAGELIGRGLGIWKMLATSGAAVRRQLSTANLGRVRKSFADYPESLYAGTPSALVNAASNSLPLPLIAATFGVSAAGFFGIVQRGLQIPVTLVARNVADVYHARLAEQGRTAPQASRRLFWRTCGALCVIGGLPSGVLAVAGPPLMRLMLGSRWDPAANLLVAMLPWTLASFVVSPLSRSVVVYRGQVQKLVYDVVSLVALVAVMIPARQLHWPLLRTIWWLSWTQAGTYIVYLAILARLLPESGAGSPRGVERVEG